MQYCIAYLQIKDFSIANLERVQG